MRLLLPSIALAFCIPVCAAVQLPTLFSDGMVLQRDAPVRVWGKASAGEKIAVEFRGQVVSAEADTIGNWAVFFKPMPAGGPFELRVKGTDSVTLRDVYVGEVWLASGQSNMEWPVKDSADAAAELRAANHPLIRFFRFPHKVSEIPQTNVWGKWEVTSPDTVADNSAVAYHFAVELEQRLNVPIGIIQSAWGGTPAEAWTAATALASEPELLALQLDWAKALAEYPVRAAQFESEFRAWQREAAAAKAAGRIPPEAPRGPLGPNHPHRPSGLYNGMIAPLVPYAIRGVIWYQGEANAGTRRRAALYRKLFRVMIEDWRRAWGEGSFPFLFAQLSSYRTLEEADWPEVRDAQRSALELRNTAMAVTIDVGDPANIHPRNKKEVGHRLALAARATVYGEPLVYSGPMFRQATREGPALRLWFDHTGKGLTARGGALEGFEIAGPSGRYVPAEARIDGDTVLVSSASVRDPLAARYAWKDVPRATLFNADGLPASPFKTR